MSSVDAQLTPGSTWKYQAAANGTITVPQGSIVLTIVAHASVAGTLTIGGGASIPIPANSSFADTMPGDKLPAPAGGLAIVATNTDLIYVAYLQP